MKRNKNREMTRVKLMTEQESYDLLIAILSHTKPEDLFPEAHKRFVEHIDRLEREGLIIPKPTPDQHQTPPSPS